MLLEVGGHFFGKGVDRVIRAVAALPEELRSRCCFCIAGAADERRIRAFGRRCGLPEQALRVLGPRKDVPGLLLAADLMVHPARNEAAGNVLLEGIASGLPVICSAACGFCDFVAEAGGVVVPEPWSDRVFLQLLTEMLGRPGEYRARIISHGGGRNFCCRAGGCRRPAGGVRPESDKCGMSGEKVTECVFSCSASKVPGWGFIFHTSKRPSGGAAMRSPSGIITGWRHFAGSLCPGTWPMNVVSVRLNGW